MRRDFSTCGAGAWINRQVQSGRAGRSGADGDQSRGVAGCPCPVERDWQPAHQPSTHDGSGLVLPINRHTPKTAPDATFTQGLEWSPSDAPVKMDSTNPYLTRPTINNGDPENTERGRKQLESDGRNQQPHVSVRWRRNPQEEALDLRIRSAKNSRRSKELCQPAAF